MAMNDEEFHFLLDTLGMSRKGYRRVRGPVKKKLGKYMERLGTDFTGFLDLVRKEDDIRSETEKALSVSVSRFFRDPELWKFLESEVFPGITRNRAVTNCWVAGCALGQEVYSLRYTFDETAAGPGSDLQITATDMNPLYLEKARKGVYKAGGFSGISAEVREQMFEPAGPGLVRVRDELRKGIAWRVHDFAKQEMEGRFQVIFLRNNLFTYYSEEKQTSFGMKVLGTLEANGFFVIGMKEKPPPGLGLNPVPDLHYVFRKS